MIRKLFVIAGVLALALAAVVLFTGFGFAQATGPGEGGYGEPGEGTGPGLEHRYGPGAGSQEDVASVATDDGDCCGAGPMGPQMPCEGGYGEPGEGTGPGMEHRYGPGTGSQEEAASVAADDDDCCGTGRAGPQTSGEGGYGEPGEGTGPGMEHRYGPGAGSQEEAASVATDDGDCCGAGPAGPQTPCEGGCGVPGEGTGPGLEHHYGPGVD